MKTIIKRKFILMQKSLKSVHSFLKLCLFREYIEAPSTSSQAFSFVREAAELEELVF